MVTGGSCNGHSMTSAAPPGSGSPTADRWPVGSIRAGLQIGHVGEHH